MAAQMNISFSAGTDLANLFLSGEGGSNLYTNKKRRGNMATRTKEDENLQQAVQALA